LGVTSAAMPRRSNIFMMWSAVMPPPAGSVWPIDFAASSARLSASGVDTSGLGAPLRTQMAMPVRATSVRPGRTLPCWTSSSSLPLSMTIDIGGLAADEAPRDAAGRSVGDVKRIAGRALEGWRELIDRRLHGGGDQGVDVGGVGRLGYGK
jgi:hypothetical protein